jgi:hypothetical protein
MLNNSFAYNPFKSKKDDVKCQLLHKSVQSLKFSVFFSIVNYLEFAQRKFVPMKISEKRILVT